jgi:protein ImuA
MRRFVRRERCGGRRRGAVAATAGGTARDRGRGRWKAGEVAVGDPVAAYRPTAGGGAGWRDGWIWVNEVEGAVNRNAIDDGSRAARFVAGRWQAAMPGAPEDCHGGAPIASDAEPGAEGAGVGGASARFVTEIAAEIAAEAAAEIAADPAGDPAIGPVIGPAGRRPPSTPGSPGWATGARDGWGATGAGSGCGFGRATASGAPLPARRKAVGVPANPVPTTSVRSGSVLVGPGGIGPVPADPAPTGLIRGGLVPAGLGVVDPASADPVPTASVRGGSVPADPDGIGPVSTNPVLTGLIRDRSLLVGLGGIDRASAESVPTASVHGGSSLADPDGIDWVSAGPAPTSLSRGGSVSADPDGIGSVPVASIPTASVRGGALPVGPGVINWVSADRVPTGLLRGGPLPAGPGVIDPASAESIPTASIRGGSLPADPAARRLAALRALRSVAAATGVAASPGAAVGRIPLGVAAVDAVLGGGLAVDALHEIHAAGPGDEAAAAGFVAGLARLCLVAPAASDAARSAAMPGALASPASFSVGFDDGGPDAPPIAARSGRGGDGIAARGRGSVGAPETAAAVSSRPSPGGRAGGGSAVVWIETRFSRAEDGLLWPPGLEDLGLPAGRLVRVALGRAVDALQAAEEALASPAPAVVVLELRGETPALDLVALRRLALAAAARGRPCLLLRTGARPQPTPAATRWAIAAAPSAAAAVGFGRRQMGAPVFSAALTRQRGGRDGAWILEWCSDAGCFRQPVSEPQISVPVDRPAPALRRHAG